MILPAFQSMPAPTSSMRHRRTPPSWTGKRTSWSIGPCRTTWPSWSCRAASRRGFPRRIWPRWVLLIWTNPRRSIRKTNLLQLTLETRFFVLCYFHNILKIMPLKRKMSHANPLFLSSVRTFISESAITHSEDQLWPCFNQISINFE